MRLSKIKKLPVLVALVLTVISSLAMSPFAFAEVNSGPNNEYCTIIAVSGDGNPWTSTVDNPEYGARSTVGSDVLGGIGGLPVMLEYSEGCRYYQFACYEVDSTGAKIGGINFTPLLKMTPTAAQCSSNTQFAQLPSSWFTAGKEYKIYSFGIFDGISTCPSSTAFVYMLN